MARAEAERDAADIDSAAEPDHVGAAADVVNDRPSWWRRTQRLRRLALVAALLMAAVVGWFIYDNNVSRSGASLSEFQAELDEALASGMQWVERDQVYLSGSGANEALIYMIRHMHERHPNATFEEMLANYRRTHRHSSQIYRRMIDPAAKIEGVDLEMIRRNSDYQRWIAYGLDPDEAPLTPEDEQSMLDPGDHHRGSLTHQIFALMHVREHGLTEHQLDELIDTLCERIAFEACLDFRVTDLYLQRVAFLLAAERPDLVKRRWIERILAAQQPDGGFLNSWHGWGPGVASWRSNDTKPTAHATVQGVWILYLLKHHYADWAEQRFDS